MARMMLRLDDELVQEAMRLTGARTKREAVEIALRELVRSLRRRQAAQHGGQVELAITVEQLWRQREET